MINIRKCENAGKCTSTRLDMNCSDGGSVIVSDTELLKFFPTIADSIQAIYSNWFLNADKECLLMAAPFPKYVAEFLIANVSQYTREPKDYKTVDDVSSLFKAIQELNLLEIHQISQAAQYCGCNSFTKALNIVMSGRETGIYIDGKSAANVHCDVDLRSGLTIRCADGGEIFICDRQFIEKLPLYAHSLSATQPNWREEKFNFSVKVPFAMKTIQFLLDNVSNYNVPPFPMTEALAKKFFPEATETSFEDLVDISEAAVFLETRAFERAISYVVLERLARLGRKRVQVLDEFEKLIGQFNYGYEPSTSTAEPRKKHEQHHCCRLKSHCRRLKSHCRNHQFK